MTGASVMDIYHKMQHNLVFTKPFLIHLVAKLHFFMIWQFTMFNHQMKDGTAALLLMRVGIQQNVNGWKLTVSCKCSLSLKQIITVLLDLKQYSRIRM